MCDSVVVTFFRTNGLDFLKNAENRKEISVAGRVPGQTRSCCRARRLTGYRAGGERIDIAAMN